MDPWGSPGDTGWEGKEGGVCWVGRKPPVFSSKLWLGTRMLAVPLWVRASGSGVQGDPGANLGAGMWEWGYSRHFARGPRPAVPLVVASPQV